MEERKYSFLEKFLPEGIPADSKEKFKAGFPDSVTIHWIGPYPHHTCDIVRGWWEKGGGEGSAHFIVKDNDVMQCWPLDKVAWHAGNSKGNRTSIGIEVVPMDEEGQFSAGSIATLKAVLDDFFPGLPIMRHYDWSGKDCPKYYITGDRWDSLKALLGRA